jgi:hypothetical protein
MIRLPKLSLVLTLFALLLLTAPAIGQQPFSSPDGVIMFTGSMPNPDGSLHVTDVIMGDEATLGSYSGGGAFDVDLSTGAINNGTVNLTFGDGSTLGLAYNGAVDLGGNITAAYTVTGGTGALSGATGSGTITGQTDFATGATADIEGTLSLPQSQPFSSPDGIVMFTGSMPNPDGSLHVTDLIMGDEATLGSYSGDGAFDVDLSTGAINNGTFNLTFGDGSTLSLAYSGAVDLGGNITATYTVTGGTGALSGATGSGTITGQTDFATGATADIEGTLIP